MGISILLLDLDSRIDWGWIDYENGWSARFIGRERRRDGGEYKRSIMIIK